LSLDSTVAVQSWFRRRVQSGLAIGDVTAHAAVDGARLAAFAYGTAGRQGQWRQDRVAAAAETA
jgi:hypothetical protein